MTTKQKNDFKMKCIVNHLKYSNKLNFYKSYYDGIILFRSEKKSILTLKL